MKTATTNEASETIKQEGLTLNVQLLKTALERVHMCTDPDSTRYALGGIQIEFAPGEIIFAATDSKRLAIHHVKCDHNLPEGKFTLDVFDCRKLMRKILKSDDTLVNFKLIKCHKTHEHVIEFSWIGRRKNPDTKRFDDHALIVSRCELVIGRFPNYHTVIPNKSGMLRPVHWKFRAKQFANVERDFGSFATFAFSDDSQDVTYRPFVLPNKIRKPRKDKIASLDCMQALTEISFDLEFIHDICDCVADDATIEAHIPSDHSAALLETCGTQYIIMPVVHNP